jgi:hypothetical protein
MQKPTRLIKKNKHCNTTKKIATEIALIIAFKVSKGWINIPTHGFNPKLLFIKPPYQNTNTISTN